MFRLGIMTPHIAFAVIVIHHSTNIVTNIRTIHTLGDSAVVHSLVTVIDGLIDILDHINDFTQLVDISAVIDIAGAIIRNFH